MKYFSIFILTVALALASCSKDSTNPSDNNNTGTNAAVVKSDKEDFTIKIGMGLYDKSYEVTAIEFNSGTSDGYGMLITFKGNGVASYNLDLYDNSITIVKNLVTHYSVPGSGKINITKYGAVGQTIEGTFTGQFLNPVDGTTFTVTSASFKATRLQDKGDDPDNSEYSFMEVKLTTVSGGSLNYSDNKLVGTATYDEDDGMLIIGVNSRPEDTKVFGLAIAIYGYGMEKTNNQSIDFNDDSDMTLVFLYNGNPHNFYGTAVMTKFAQKVGDEFEISGSGEFFSMLTDSKVGDIQSFKIKVKRTKE
jgi:hypothetical protein